ncbi:hypothetical protein [Streptomyces tagetis]|uniref:Uncharacterized protein n=1 Tax=Streptomyces tagetis TaxID=2820809 RepID=A0A941B971_9ACTN|nr:hypothetical protein [Streptomyces sp. RG38]MBQ0829258.1 hypothetical protein [Streptomyces sp. RG38]
MDTTSRKAALKKATFPAIVGLLLVGWITYIVVAIANEPEKAAAPSAAALTEDIAQALADGDAGALREHLSAQAGDGYAEALVDRFSALPGTPGVTREGTGDHPFAAIRQGGHCLGFDLRKTDDGWVMDAVPRLQGCEG